MKNDVESLIQEINNLTDNLGDINNLPFDLNELMNDSFIKKNTKYNSFNNLLDNAPFNIKSYNDIEKNINEFNLYVKKNTKFENWEEMIGGALLSLIDFT